MARWRLLPLDTKGRAELAIQPVPLSSNLGVCFHAIEERGDASDWSPVGKSSFYATWGSSDSAGLGRRKRRRRMKEAWDEFAHRVNWRAIILMFEWDAEADVAHFPVPIRLRVAWGMGVGHPQIHSLVVHKMSQSVLALILF